MSELRKSAGEPGNYPADQGAAPASGLPALAWRWLISLRGTSYVEAGSAALHTLLGRLTERLAGALTAQPFAPEAGTAIGETLVAAGVARPEALRRSMVVLAGLPAALAAESDRTNHGHRGEPAVVQGQEADPDPTLVGRTAELLAAVAAGFCAALQQRTLAEQERIRQAALGALSLAEQARSDSEARLRAVFRAAGTAIAVGDLTGRLTEVNPALAQMLGVPSDELIGRAVFDFFHPEDVPVIRERIYAELVSGTRSGTVRLEVRFRRGDGGIGWTTLAVSLVRAPDGQPAYLVAVGEDVTDRHRLQSQLRHQAHHDPLTGLPNRALLYQRLTEALRDPRPDARIGICFLDLDQFKAVNDTLGHSVGDRLLVAVADRLRERVAEAGHFIARVGGDEFVVVARDVRTSAEVTRLAQGLLDTLTEPVRVGEHRLAVSASIGVLDRPVLDADPEDLLRAADATLYVAKTDGRARWALFDPDRNATDLLRYDLAARIPAAIEAGEFFLEYQPIVGLTDGTPRGAEALVRWRHPELGLLGPNLFIPIAEQSGTIVPLGRWVLREAVAAASRWTGHPGWFISVNLSPRQCAEPSLPDDVAAALCAAGLSNNRLQLEITETAVVHQDDRSQHNLRTIAGTGVRIVLDDFGIGYSNLAQLRLLPLTGVKLAGTFMAGVRSADPDHVDGQILATVIALAHTIGLTVTAEGVESAAQARLLSALGCDLGQGWHFGVPAGPDLPRRLQAARAAAGT